ncbi:MULTISPECIES: glutamate racemase [unclassified Sphingopyxis]|uniref:glutamate racemase n=1 Tax=unclassified Sphingopyxis TaxID=2614943 RepID=UPI000731AF6F|nr:MULTISPECIES: glutamate racemase [unclassified Sphingopyxis]KTE25392.1 glutamate racemase [Sphingopyxis sp. H057]KTE53413.1 glutamate racemase [Sphingopyxis sp. H073]KTE56003.1 glutamate racemase [Sphingopyxis sp. H071]KTE62882.1 glutamate racemase [Sphingopyxis sp. H107]KTE66971.1 glutamate racemase [Sphingopyxis sp. H100]
MDHSPDPDSPLLFFDSGLGGLSVLGPTRALLPTAPFVYAADYAGLPYGKKTNEELAARVPALLGRLVERYQPRLAVIACNTASTIALPHVRAALDLPIVGTVPAIKPAAELTETGVIGVLGTEATVRQPYVDDLSAKFASDKTVLRHGSPGLVTGAEAKLRGDPVDPAVIERAVAGLRDQPGGDALDVIVLACTHFPLLEQELRAAFGPDVALIDGAAGIARRVAHLTKGQSWPAAPSPGIAVFTRSEDRPPPPLAALAPYGIGSIETI